METGGNPKSTKQKTAQKKVKKMAKKRLFFVNFVTKNIYQNLDIGNTVKGVNLYQKK